jgi:hypothetical protein
MDGGGLGLEELRKMPQSGESELGFATEGTESTEEEIRK